MVLATRVPFRDSETQVKKYMYVLIVFEVYIDIYGDK